MKLQTSLILAVLLIVILSCEISSAGKQYKYSSYYSSHAYKPHNKIHKGGIPPGYVDGKLCNRECDGRRMSCFFEFDLELFHTMSKACWGCPNPVSDCYRPDCIVGGGVSRVVSVVNRQLPGPAIQVCKGDEIMVQVRNSFLDASATTIHWHGILMVADKYMDGAPWVTQCPIDYNNNFTYEFWAVDPGTHWWHSHVELQRGDGCFGPLIVRETRKDNKHSDKYDTDLSEHIIMIFDWNDDLRVEVFERAVLQGKGLQPSGILINGLGPQFNNNVTNTPLANFVVEEGKRHRFRVINSGFFDCPLQFSIEKHKISVISTDGHNFEPVEVSSFMSSSGERYDFILHANQKPGTYYIRVKGYHTCARLKSYTLATIQYKGTSGTPIGPIPTYEKACPTGGVLLNPISKAEEVGYTTAIPIDKVKSLRPIEKGLDTKYPYKFYVSLDMNGVDNPLFHKANLYGFNQVPSNLRARTPQFNRISYKPLDVPFLAARNYIKDSQLCNVDTMKERDCLHNFCECPHVIKVPLNAVVEIILMELWDQNAKTKHPIHIHGHTFKILGIGEYGQNFTRQQVIDMDEKGQFKRNYDFSPSKDTIPVPRGGYVILRFIANNAGFWLMHCHIDVHSSEGMDLVIKVGENHEMPDPPKGFPVCGNWVF